MAKTWAIGGTMSYGVLHTERGWVIICPDESVYPVPFGDNEIAARDTAHALNLVNGLGVSCRQCILYGESVCPCDPGHEG